MRLAGRICLAGVLAAAGCHSEPSAPTPPRAEVAVTVERAQYSLASDSIAQVTLTNRSSGPVFLPTDTYVFYERLEGDVWDGGHPWLVADGVGRSYPLAPGEVTRLEFPLRYYARERPGTYRIWFLVYADSGLQELLPLEQRTSAAFVVAP